MRRVWLFGCTLALACGPAPDCVTDTLSLQVMGPLVRSKCKDYEHQAHAFYVTFAAAAHLDERFGFIDERVTGTRVNLKQNYWGCDQFGVCLAGQAYCHMYEVDIAEEEDPLASALIHELVHVAQGCMAWPLEGQAPDPRDGSRAGHEGWARHGIWERIDFAEEALLKRLEKER